MVEDHYARLENQWGITCDVLRSGDPMTPLTYETKRSFAEYLQVLPSRHPEALSDFTRTADELLGDLKHLLSEESALAKAFRAEFHANDEGILAPFHIHQDVLSGHRPAPEREDGSWADRLARWVWIRIDATVPLFLTDKPVVANLQEPVGWAARTSPISVVSVCLSPERLLLIAPTTWASELGLEDEQTREAFAVTHLVASTVGANVVWSATALDERWDTLLTSRLSDQRR